MKTTQDSTKLALDLFLNKLSGKYHKFVPGQTIFAEGDYGDTMLLVLSGRVRILKRSSDGKKLRPIAYRSAGEFIGEMALVESSPRSATVEAEEACEVLEFNHAQFEKAIKEQPSLATKVLRSLSRKLRESDNRQVRVLEEANKLLSESNHELIGLNSFLDCIIDQTPSAVILVTARGELFRINHSGLSMFEIDSTAHLGHVDDLFVGIEFKEIRKDLVQTWTGQVIGRRSDKPFPVYLSIRPLSGHPDGILYLLMCQDISDLEERNYATTDYEKFTASQHAVVEMSHGASRILSELQDEIETLADLIPGSGNDALKNVRSATDRLSLRVRHLAEDYLINRCNSTEFTFADLRAMVRDVTQRVEAMSRYEKIAVVYSIADDFPRKLLMRAGQVQGVLLNVIMFAADQFIDDTDNAEPQVSVEMEYAGDDKTAVITVVAKGARMDDETAADALAQGMSGLPNDYTLGLGMIRSIVEIHGGVLSMDNRRSDGLSIEVRLPLRQTAGDHD